MEKKALFLNVYKQSGSNTIAVTKGVKKAVQDLEKQFSEGAAAGNPKISIVQDGSKAISDNVWDVEETIVIGILLTVIVVFLFLGSGRSTIITSLALPNSVGCIHHHGARGIFRKRDFAFGFNFISGSSD